MSPPETLLYIVWVLVGIGISVMGTMIRAPIKNTHLEGSGAHEEEDNLQRPLGVKRAMRPQSVVSCGNTETSDVVACEGEGIGLPVEREGQDSI